jgi:hypothetical protein
MEAPLPAWPANFSRLSFERLCAMCDGGCSCNGALARLAAERRPECRPCHGDKLVWVPRRYLRPVSEAVLKRGGAGHSLVHAVREADGGRSAEVGYLFPEECGEFPIQLICNELGAYRPAHRDPGTGALPPTPQEWARNRLVTNWQRRRRRHGEAAVQLQ